MKQSLQHGDTNIYDVLEKFDQNSIQVQPKTQKKSSTLRSKSEGQFIKAACMSSQLEAAKHSIKQVKRKEKDNMQKFMKVWIILEKLDLLQQSAQVFKRHLKISPKLTEQQNYVNLILDSLIETDLKSAYTVYCGEVCKEKKFKDGLAELNKFRRNLRKIQTD